MNPHFQPPLSQRLSGMLNFELVVAVAEPSADGNGTVPKLFPRSPSPYAGTSSSPCTAGSLLMRCLLVKVAEQILFDLWRADFPNTTIDEVVMNIDEGQKNHGTKR